jgi:hypothetical protein
MCTCMCMCVKDVHWHLYTLACEWEYVHACVRLSQPMCFFVYPCLPATCTSTLPTLPLLASTRPCKRSPSQDWHAARHHWSIWGTISVAIGKHDESDNSVTQIAAHSQERQIDRKHVCVCVLVMWWMCMWLGFCHKEIQNAELRPWWQLD